MMWRRKAHLRWREPLPPLARLRAWRARWQTLSPKYRALGLSLLAALLTIAATVGIMAVRAPDETEHFGERVAGQRVYDHSGLLSKAQVDVLERHAESIERFGVPVVVYIRIHEADSAATESDAIELMHAWGVESSPGAGDGLVLFLNLDPDDFSSDDAALASGTKLKQTQLPPTESERIVAGVLQSLWSDAPTATGIVQGVTTSLKATERRLLFGAPPEPTPGPVSRAAATFARLPLALLSLVGIIAAGVSGYLVWHRRAPILGLPASLTVRATDVPPVLGAALAEAGITPTVLHAAVAELAKSGAVAMVCPARPIARIGQEAVAPGIVRLVARPHRSDRVGQAAWDLLAEVADDANIVSPEAIAQAARHPGHFAVVVRQELEARGWWDSVAPRRRTPLLRVSMGLLVASVIAAIIALAGGEPWGVIPTALLALGAVATWLVARSYPIVTPTGRTVADRWREAHQPPTLGGNAILG